MKEKVLITGASGFVGYHLIIEALKNNLEVFAAIRKSSQIDHLQDMGIHFVFFDFLDKESIRKNFEKDQYDYILHAAGLTRARTLQEYNLVNSESSLNLAEVALDFPIKKFVFLSSLAVIGPVSYAETMAIHEDQSPHPVTNYGRSKLEAENALLRLTKLPLVILRPTAVYGPREKDLLIMFKSLRKGLEPYIGSQEQHLSFIYVKDLAEVTFTALFSDKNHEVYHLSDGNIYTRYDLAKFVKKALKQKTLHFTVPMGIVKVIARIMETASRKKAPVLNLEKLNELAAENWNCSIEKAKKDFNFQAKYDLEKGIEETISWYQKHKWL